MSEDEHLEIARPDPAERRGPLPEVRRGGKAIDIVRRRPIAEAAAPDRATRHLESRPS